MLLQTVDRAVCSSAVPTFHVGTAATTAHPAAFQQFILFQLLSMGCTHGYAKLNPFGIHWLYPWAAPMVMQN